MLQRNALRKTRRQHQGIVTKLGHALLPGLLLLTMALPVLAQSSPRTTPTLRDETPRRYLQAILSAQAPRCCPASTEYETAPPPLALKGPPPDPWLGFDKAQHAAFSFLWTLGSQYTFVNKMDLTEQRALPLSVGTGAVLGLAKEVYDWRVGRHRYFSYRDLIADAVGLLLGAGLIAL